MSVLAIKPVSSVLIGVKRVLSSIGDLFVTIAAAGAVSNALENHRQPAAADLRVLGIENARFKQYY